MAAGCAAVLASAGLVAASQPRASAVATTSVTYAEPGTYTWTVPSNIDTIFLDVYGAQGGGDCCSAMGGKGARVHALARVSPGQVLEVTVGGTTDTSSGGFGGGGDGGAATGGWSTSWFGYGGGGASRVSLGGQSLVVAGGGGGGAGSGPRAGGASGASAAPGYGTTDGQGGAAGTLWGPGAGGSRAVPVGGSCSVFGTDGEGGALGVGGAGGGGPVSDTEVVAFAGGGGGGGYYGGGGGGASDSCDYLALPRGSAGGGGGGSSFSQTGVSATVTEGVRTGDGQVTISFADGDAPVAAPVLTPVLAPAVNGWYRSDVTATWNWADDKSGIDPARCAATTTMPVYPGMAGPANVGSTCRDLLGNLATAVVRIKVDTMAPKGAPSVVGDSIRLSWTDLGSGIDPSRCPSTVPNTRATVTCFDIAGNSTSVQVGPVG